MKTLLTIVGSYLVTSFFIYKVESHMINATMPREIAFLQELREEGRDLEASWQEEYIAGLKKGFILMGHKNV